MNMRFVFSIIGPLIAALGFLPYLKETAKGIVKPRVASWATWSLVTGIATIIELSILIMALRKGDYDYNWVDGASQTISILGIVVRLTTSNPVWAIIFNILADFFGAVPTFYHSWIKPHDESWLPFILSGIGAGLSFMGVKYVGMVSAGFPVYLSIIGFALGLNIYFRQKVVTMPKRPRTSNP